MGQNHFARRITPPSDSLRSVHLRLLEPARPGLAHGGNLAVFHPLNAPRDGDAAPQGARERLTFLAAGVTFGLDAEATEVPVPALGQGGDGPVCGVESQVCACVAGLKCQRGVAEKYHAEHEH